MALQEVYRFEVLNEDLIVDLRPDQSLFDLMSIICDEWLDDTRDGDGGVNDHMWIIQRSGSHRQYTGPYDEDSSVHTRGLQDLRLSPGCTLSVRYDMGSTTDFSVKFESIQQVSGDITLPQRLLEPDNIVEYSPPAGSPNLDEVFPDANELLFGESSVAQRILPFPFDSDCAGVVEAGPNAMSDVVFMPVKFENITELLVAFNEAGKHQPPEGYRKDAFSRMTFPKTMTKEDEDKYNAFKKELDEYEKYCKDHDVTGGPEDFQRNIPEHIMYRMCGPKEVMIRVNDLNMQAVKDVNVEQAFPLCARAYQENFWISYRRGKMMVCKGYGSSRDRGIPVPGSVLAQTSRAKIQSLQEFFCVAEALFKRVEIERLWKKKDQVVNTLVARKMDLC